jgi:glycosyltransferase involved in cell wall biosynthesis
VPGENLSDAKKNLKVSACVITLNEEGNIERALKSLSFADEIVLVDSGSADKTVELAKKYTDRIFYREWGGFTRQRNFAIDKCENDWIIPLDADEEITPECRDKIVSILKEGTEKTWFKIRRKEHFNGVHMTHGIDIPSEQIRLFRKSKGRYAGNVHEYPRMEGERGYIDEPINHFSYKNFGEMVGRTLSYAKLAADEKFRNGERRGYFYKYGSGLAQFLKSYITHLGILDGLYGLYRSIGNGLEFYYRQDILYRLWKENETR